MNEPRIIEMDPNELTLDDLETFETMTGLQFMEMQGKNFTAFPVKAINVLVWLFRRHEEPELTLEECKRTTKIKELGLAQSAEPVNPQ